MELKDIHLFLGIYAFTFFWYLAGTFIMFTPTNIKAFFDFDTGKQ